MTTEHELDQILRRALHATVDSVEPAGDGLQRIQGRLAEPRLRRQWRLLLTETYDLVCQAGIRLEPVAARGWATLRRALVALVALAQPATADGGGPARRGAAHRSQPAGPLARLTAMAGWMRPALVVAGAVTIVVAGVFGLVTLRSTVTDISVLTGGGGNQGPSAGSPSGSSSSHSRVPGSSPAPAGVLPSAHTKGRRHHPAPAATCSPGSRSGSSPSPSATPTVSPSVMPTPTDTATPAPSASAAVTPAGSTTPPLVGGPVQIASGCASKASSTVSTSPTP